MIEPNMGRVIKTRGFRIDGKQIHRKNDEERKRRVEMHRERVRKEMKDDQNKRDV